ncbi:AAA family ATPase [Nonomuraea sp. NEAU-A123]|uniref:nSTAND1 domain-containing NTPase n=1 Tax=Nonomuraea sp. NEAU-A123 TaxID=2839649 RepID=UPI001BE4CD89|nr:AAA family ATPase [Nonomuraea sp. NEAU-A123]MBT2232125.1 AAA family ATPase [Nonomuraea sp. NEAU-A123]
MGIQPPDDPSELMRAGIRARIMRLTSAAGTGARRWTPPTLLAVLSAGALGPLLIPGATATAALVGALAAVGGNVLTDLVKAAINRLGPGGPDTAAAGRDLQTMVEQEIQVALEAGGERADQLRAEIAEVMRHHDLVGAAIEQAVISGDRLVQRQLATGLARLGEQFTEFGFVAAEMALQLRLIRTRMDQASADLQVSVGLQYRQTTDIRLLADQVAVIEQRTRDPGGSQDRTRPAIWEQCPYKGLVAFHEDDAPVFYGREVIVAELVATLAQRSGGPSLVVVTGASGAGKSSLLRAGLLPELARGKLSEQARLWPRAVLDRPTSAPLERLATLLAGLTGLEATSVLRQLADHPEQSHLLVRQAVEADAARRGLTDRQAAASRLLLVVDQFEEIFTAADDSSAAAHELITVLHSAATHLCGPEEIPAAVVVMAVRGDYIDRCADFRLLAQSLAQPFIVGPMSELELRLTITGPAAEAGLELEPGLADDILTELRQGPGEPLAGTLPLLSQAMLTIWEHREGIRLTHHGYDRTGGVRQAVATSADVAYRELSEEAKAAARRLFQQLTLVTADGVPARRAVPRSALGIDDTGNVPADGGLAQLLEVFTRRRLLVVDRETVQIAHDALLVSWPQLRGWLEGDLAAHAQYSQLLDDARNWQSNGRRASYLYRGEQLASVRELVPSWQANTDRYPDLGSVPAEFLTAAITAETRTTRLRRTLMTALAALLLLSTGTAAIAIRLQQTAIRERDSAASQVLAARSEQVPDDNPRLAAQLAAAAWRVDQAAEARYSMTAVTTRPLRAVLSTRDGYVSSVAFSPDGRVLASGSHGGGEGWVRLWDPATGKQIGHALHDPDGRVRSVAFSPDGHTLATASSNEAGENAEGWVRLWDPATGKQIGHALHDPDGRVWSVAFSPDGHTLATASSRSSPGSPDIEGWVRLWDPASGKRIGPPLHVPGSGVSSVAFSPDGRILAGAGGHSIGDDGSEGWIRLWDPATGKQIGPTLRDPDGRVNSVDFSPDGRTLASGSGASNGWVRLWDPATGKQTGPTLRDPDGRVNSVDFSPDGRTLASGSGASNGWVRLWDPAGGEQIGPALRDPDGAVASVAFSPDGKTLASATHSFIDNGGLGWVRLWGPATGRQIGPTLQEPDGDVSSLAFSPDGRTLASASSRDTSDGDSIEGWIRLWDPATGKQTGPAMHNPDGEVSSVAFSPDGRILAGAGGHSIGDDGSEGWIRLWDPATGKQIGPTLRDPDGRVNSVDFSPDGRTLASGSDSIVSDTEGWIRLWDPATGKQTGPAMHDPDGKVSSVAFSPDGKTLASASSGSGGGENIEGWIRLWDPATGKQTGPAMHDPDGKVSSVAFSPDGGTLASGSGASGGWVRLWDRATGKQAGPALRDPDGSVTSVTFNPDGRTLASASGRVKADINTAEGWIRLWDRATGRQIGPALHDPVGYAVSAVFSPDGHTLASGSRTGDLNNEQGWVRLMAGPPSDLPAAMCALPGDPLTQAEWDEYARGVEFRAVCP